MPPEVMARGSVDRRHHFAAIAAASIVLVALYVATAPRSVIPIGVDSAKFAYMGRILGVPHSPGYPLYLLISWLFSWLPVGTLAFRMNLLSACFGVATAMLVISICLDLGTSALIAAMTGLLLGSGPLFWSQAIIAEVYTLHTSLIAGMALALLAWRRTREPRLLYCAALCFGLGMAHHTDIAVFVPAVIAFVVMVDATVFRSLKTLLGASVAAIAPLGLYAYVIVRTRQEAEYVEAGARTLGELFDVVRGRQFSDRLFTTGFAELLRSRTVWVGQWLVAELGLTGCALAIIGAAVLWRRNKPMALFVLLGTSGVLIFVLSYFTLDLEVFILPVLVLCWICVGVALDALANIRPRRHAVVAAFAVIWTCWLAASNFAVNDLHDTPASRYFDAFFARFRAGAVIVQPNLTTAHMVLYKVLGEPQTTAPPTTLAVWSTHGGREFSLVPSTPEHPVATGDDRIFDRFVRDGRNVFAFGPEGEAFRAHGFGVEPVRLPDRTIGEFLAGIDRRAIIALAIPAGLAARTLTAEPGPFRAIGSTLPTLGSADCYVIVGRKGIRALESASPMAGITLDRDTTRLGGGLSPATVVAQCAGTFAEIAVNGRVVSRTDSSVPIVVVNERGLVTTETIADGGSLRVPFDWRVMPTYRVVKARTCASIGAQWTDVGIQASQAGLAVHVAPHGFVRLRLESPKPLRIRAARANTSHLPIRVTSGDELDGRSASLHRASIEIDGTANGTTSVVDIALGGVPAAAEARQASGQGDSEVCALTLGNYPVLAGTVDGFERILMDNARDELFGAGWHAFEGDGGDGFRWTSSTDAHLLVPLRRSGALDVRMDALLPAPAVNSRLGPVTLVMNGREIAAQPGVAGWSTYRWRIPADAVRPALNELAIRVPRTTPAPNPDTRLLGLCVREIDFHWVD